MKSRTLAQLFLVDFVIFLTGMGLLPLLPIYAQSFGADQTGSGFYMAITYAAITAGTLLTNRLARAVGYRRLFVGAGSLGVVALVGLGQAVHFWQLALLTAVIWFSGGIGIASVNVFTSLSAHQKSRGKSFSLTFLSMPLASFVAGLTVGELAEWRGYPFMFATLALAWAAWPILAIVGFKEWPAAKVPGTPANNGRQQKGLGRAFYVLMAATLLSATTVYLLRISTSFAMHALDFSPGDISGTSAVAGLVTLPLAYAVGALSDRFGRRRFVAGSYFLGAIGAVVLVVAGLLWHFWVATAFVVMALNASGAVAPALATDLLPAEARSRGLPYLGSMRNIAGIIGFASGGLLVDKAGAFYLYLVAALLSVTATLLISQLRAGTPEAVIQAEPSPGGRDLTPAPANS